jgi:hypothetical protein
MGIYKRGRKGNPNVPRRARFPGPPSPRAVIPPAPPRARFLGPVSTGAGAALAGQNPLMGAIGPSFFNKKYHPNSKGRNIR